MATGDLTSVGNVKLWLAAGGGTSMGNTNDALLGRLVSAASSTVKAYLSRPYIGSTLITERYDGPGGDTLMVRHGPVSSVVSIQYDGVTVTTQATGNPPTGGYLLDNSLHTVGRITLTDDTYSRGRLNVLVSYWAGHQVSGEAHTAALAVQPLRTWLTDVGVTYATSGVALTLVTGAPAVGQYAVTAGNYQFNTSDAGAAILITYGTIPYDLEQVVIEIVGEAYKRMARIGMSTQTLGGQETTSYSAAPLNNAAKMMLAPHRRVAQL